MVLPSSGPEIVSWPELLRTVEKHHGILRVTMGTLRELEGAQRVGRQILDAIDNRLKSLGMGHLPLELPNRQEETVVLYLQSTPVSGVIRAIVQGLSNPLDDTSYRSLYDFNRPVGVHLSAPREVTETATNAISAVEELVKVLNARAGTQEDELIQPPNRKSFSS